MRIVDKNFARVSGVSSTHKHFEKRRFTGDRIDGVHANALGCQFDRHSLWWYCSSSLSRHFTNWAAAAGRPAVSEKRLALTSNGKIRYQLKTPCRDGTTHVIFEPLDFIARLAALAPKPRVNLSRFHGVFTPNSKHRIQLTPVRRGKGSQQHTGTNAWLEKTPPERRRAMTWMQHLKRVFNIDIETCERCGGQVKVIASNRSYRSAGGGRTYSKTLETKGSLASQHSTVRTNAGTRAAGVEAVRLTFPIDTAGRVGFRSWVRHFMLCCSSQSSRKPAFVFACVCPTGRLFYLYFSDSGVADTALFCIFSDRYAHILRLIPWIDLISLGFQAFINTSTSKGANHDKPHKTHPKRPNTGVRHAKDELHFENILRLVRAIASIFTTARSGSSKPRLRLLMKRANNLPQKEVSNRTTSKQA